MKPFDKNLKVYFLLVLFGIPNILWMLAKASQSVPLIPELLPTYLSQLFAINGVMLMCLNFILAARIKFLERLFAGLDKMYKFHKNVGRFAFTLLWFHPVFLLLNNFFGLNSILLYFTPGPSLAYNLGMAALYILTILIFLTVVFKLPYHIWKRTHKLMVLALIFAGAHINLIDSDVSLFSPLKIWLLSFIFIGILMWLYVEIIYSRFGNHVHHYRVQEVNLKGEITELVFENISNPIKYVGGQFAMLSFVKNKVIGSELHPYTLSSGPHASIRQHGSILQHSSIPQHGSIPQYDLGSQFTRISAKGLGDYSKQLREAKVGDEVKLIGPYGFFTYDSFSDKKRQVWISGGIGVTPFLAMLSDISSRNVDNEISFIYSVKNREEATYLDEIKSNISKLKNAKLVEHYSDETGFLNAPTIENLIGSKLSDHFILMCGPTPMTRSLRTNLKTAGIDPENIVFEDFDFK